MQVKAQSLNTSSLMTKVIFFIGALITIVGFTLSSASPSEAVSTSFNPYPGTTITAGTATLNTVDATTASITDLQVGANNPGDEVPVQLSVTSGSLSLGTTTGLTFTPSGTTSGATISFKGTRTNVNAALATLSFTKGGSNSSTLTAKLWDPSKDFTCSTGHLYRVVKDRLTYDNAKSAAQSAFNNNGYLVTPTTADENTCVFNNVKSLFTNPATPYITWIGAVATLSSTTVSYTWSGGPENGTRFWEKAGRLTDPTPPATVATAASTHGTSVNGAYANWDLEGSLYQPNADYLSSNSSLVEPCVVFYNASNASGTWHDVPCGVQSNGQYVIEADLPSIASTTITLNFSTSTPTPTPTPSVASVAPVSPTATASQLASTASTPIRSALPPIAVILFGLSLISYSIYRQQIASRRDNK